MWRCFLNLFLTKNESNGKDVHVFLTAVSVSSFLIFHNWKMHKNGNIKNQKVWFCLLFKKHQKSHQKPVMFLQEKTLCVYCGLLSLQLQKQGGSFVNEAAGGSPPSTRSQAPICRAYKRYHEAWWDLAPANWSLKKLGWSQMSLNQSSFPDLVKVCAFFLFTVGQLFFFTPFFLKQFLLTNFQQQRLLQMGEGEIT